MKSSDSASFLCNVCGAECARPAAAMERDAPSCASCGSSVRLRGLALLLSQELFGAALTVPEFPVLRGVRGLGMSDPPELESRLGSKFDYTNTFYHKAPHFDVNEMDERDLGRYDFILSSEVMEHVAPPVEQAFDVLGRMLKPDGVLILTTPFGLKGATREHFPELHEYMLATLGDRTVLVNRRRDGSVEVFEDLVFHGGPGSTLELRLFTEESLRGMLCAAGFDSVRVAPESLPEFGIEHAGNWSLPIVARKGRVVPPIGDIVLQYRDACRRESWAARDRDQTHADYERHVAFHAAREEELKRDIEERTQWARKMEADFKQRTEWALSLEREHKAALEEFERVKKSETEGWERAEKAEKELAEARAERERLEAKWWWRIAKRLR